MRIYSILSRFVRYNNSILYANMLPGIIQNLQIDVRDEHGDQIGLLLCK